MSAQKADAVPDLIADFSGQAGFCRDTAPEKKRSHPKEVILMMRRRLR
jgi:hypothetical protein